MQLTSEQRKVVDTVVAGADPTTATAAALVVTAGAGSGKTSTLFAAAQAVREAYGRDVRIVVTAFNKDVIADAKNRFGDLAKCQTTHSLAYATHGRHYRARMDNNPNDRPKGLAAKLGFKGEFAVVERPAAGRASDDLFVLKTVEAARLISKTVDRFCSSADFDIAEHHIPHIIDRDHALYEQVTSMILDGATDMWDELQKTDGRKFRFTHDMYRKLWALSQPRIACDVIMLDEAQDTPPVVEAVFRAQEHAMRIAVGDSSQSLYEFTGAVDALRKLKDADPTTVEHQLRQSFRFGQKIADLANRWLALPVMRTGMQIVGNPALDSRIAMLTSADAVLCRTNAGAFSVVVTNVMAGRKVALVGNIKGMQSLVFGLKAIQKGQTPRHPDLAVFECWDDVTQAMKEEDADNDLKIAVQIVEAYGADKTLAIISSLVAEADADVVVSTAHKSKGRQWNSVKIHDDFAPKVNKDGSAVPVTRAWGNLAYVAVTRAQLVLDPGPLAVVGP
jgi:superfamily I DNA/RNA helicase